MLVFLFIAAQMYRITLISFSVITPWPKPRGSPEESYYKLHNVHKTDLFQAKGIQRVADSGAGLF